MKKLLALLPLLALSSLAYAAQPVDRTVDPATDMTGQQRDAKASLYVGSIRSTIRDITVANKEGTALSAEVAHQLNTSDLIFNARATYESELAKHNENAKQQGVFTKDVNAQTDNWNGKCTGSVAQDAYNWCIAEQARLTPLVAKASSWAADAQKTKDALDLQSVSLDQLGAQLNKDGYAQHERVLKYIEKSDLLIKRIEDFKARLEDLQTGYDACKDFYKNGGGPLEKLHETCGSMFDGNIVQQTETNYPVPDPTFKMVIRPDRCTPLNTYCQKTLK